MKARPLPFPACLDIAAGGKTMNDRNKKTAPEKLRREVLRAYDQFMDNEALIGLVFSSIVLVYLLARLAMGAK
jgi:hypothetical protein